MTDRDNYTVSGPDVDKKYPSGSVALSAAITFASHARDETTYYVRDRDGSIFGYAERFKDGSVEIHRTEAAR